SPDLLKDPDFTTNLGKIKQRTLRLRVEKVQNSGDSRQAAILYMQLAERFPKDPEIDQILYNAGINFERARLIGLAITARQRLIEVAPTSPLAKKAIYRVGQNFQAIAAY